MALLNLKVENPISEGLSVKIPSYSVNQEGKFAIYTIRVALEAVWWTVIRRYKEFEAFDVQYFTDRSKSFLPPKRIVGNMNADFLEERRRELEKYLTTVLEMDVFQQKKNGLSSLSFVLAKFLDFHQYEVHAIVEDLSERLGRVGDSWLSRSEKAPKYFEFTPVDLHAIHVRLQLAEPTHPDSKPNLDVAHTVEFLQRVKSVKIRGTRGGGYLGSSNILANQLPFSLAFCKNLLALWVADCDVRSIDETTNLRGTLRRLVVHYSMHNLEDLLVDAESGVQPLNSRPRWTRLEDADFSFNQLTRIDESIIVLRTLTKLNLSHNALKSIDSHLQHLPFLATLDLSHNAIEDVKDWHEKLGNIKNLNLSSNNIRDIEGLSRLLSLETLDVSSNSLSSLAAIASMGRLPCLDVLLLRANPIRKMVDYRTKVLEVFGRRAAEVKLDSRRPDSREMDTINVRLALRQAREEREEQMRLRQLSIDERIRYISGGPLDSEAKSL